MTAESPLARARDAALDVLRGHVPGAVRTAAMVAGSLAQHSHPDAPVFVSMEAAGPAAILRIDLATNCPALTRAGYVAAAGALGVETLILFGEGVSTGAQREFGGLAAVEDHINLLGDSPLIGRHDPALGPRFPDMSAPYSRRLLDVVRRQGAYPGCTYAACSEDQLRVLGYRKWLWSLGADLAGPWIVPELLAARQGSIEVLAFVTPMGADCLWAMLPAEDRRATWDRIMRPIAQTVADRCESGGWSAE